jgi:uncharacterized membrane protein
MEPMVILRSNTQPQHLFERTSHLASHLRCKPRNRQHTPRILLQRLKPVIMSQQLGNAELFALDPAARSQKWSDNDKEWHGRAYQNFLAWSSVSKTVMRQSAGETMIRASSCPSMGRADAFKRRAKNALNVCRTVVGD